MNVLFVSSYYPPYVFGGAEVSTSLLIQNLPKTVHPTVVTSILQNEEWEHEGVKVVPLLKVIGLGKKSLFDLVSYAFKVVLYPWLNGWYLYNYLQKHNFDAVHLVPHSYLNVGLVLAIFLAKKRCVIDVRDFTWICLTDFSYGAKQSELSNHSCYSHLTQSYHTHQPLLKILFTFVSFYETTLFTLYMFVIKQLVKSPHFTSSALSQYTKQLLVDAGFDEKNITVIPNVLHSKTFEDHPRKKEIVFAGRLEPSKGIWQVIKAFEQAQPKGFTLHLYGTGSEYESIQQYVEKQHHSPITLHGRQSQEVVMEAYNSSYAIIAPAIRPEPLGRYVLDSFLTKTPLITSKVGGPPEYIQDKVNGILVDPESIEEISTAITDLTQHTRLHAVIQSNLQKLPKELETQVIIKKRMRLYG